ncbi:hypothetical protein K1T71_005337 [Dendrolimus kikuchii]|uniref:Uncharacterized protein n=1 Tax=Dendrolimus kikuchii TaxID=765133 RepID=A0ACC1D6Z9_9NEOP|nr:hypothetical protein K1T71_005337 [Dendrolimus kikuchii]
MWKRSVVQASARGELATRASTALPLLVLAFAWVWSGGGCADLVIEIPGSGAGLYRLDYRPPQGSPAPNFTVPARANTINFQGLPGTKYHFMLYYSNATFADLLTWNQTIITAPEPPTNLNVTLGRNKQATISWSPPAHGDYTGFRFKVIPLTERADSGGGGAGGGGGGGGARNITVDGDSNWTYTLRDLYPGATYQLHAFTLLHDKESAAYTSTNFTTKPNTPGKFIVWFRNETTLLVLWQPPYPPGAYTHYKVSIEPRDARDSELYVEKEGEPPGPAQAAFKGLVPGRAYNISVQTVSEPAISAPTTAQYRTVPLRPRNVSVAQPDLHETSFRVTWLPPLDESEFEKYQVSVSASGAGGGGGGGGGGRRLAPGVRLRNESLSYWFEGLEPGAKYVVTVKTMSGKVTSWPATAEFYLKPLPVQELRAELVGADGGVRLTWAPAEGSTQDEYKVSYHEAGSREDSNSLSTPHANVTLEGLLPGRNYAIAVRAVSHGVESNETSVGVATRPLAPVVQDVTPGAHSLRLHWRSDVNSRQDHYELRYGRWRAAAADHRTMTTTNTSATLEGLFPGAVYEVQVAALSNDLHSEWTTLLNPVRPLPARALNVSRATSDSALAQWAGPERGAGALGGFALRYRTLDDARWTNADPIAPDTNHAEISNMVHGERYVIELDTVSEAAQGVTVDSGEPLRAQHTVRPSPVSNVAQLVDTRNMTLEWPVPVGRVERYSARWWPAGEAQPRGEANITGATAGASASATVRAALGGLEPGRAYTVAIAAHSYHLTSDIFTMDTRTKPLIQSEMSIVPGDDDDTQSPYTALTVLYTQTPSRESHFDSYRLRLEAAEGEGEGGEGGAAQTAERAADEQPRQVVFAGLVPGRLYNVTMWTVSHNVTSHPVQRQTRLHPRAIRRLAARAAGAREITLTWERPVGVFTDFEVQYLAAEDQLRTLVTRDTNITVDGLRPYTLYNFTVLVRAGRSGSLRAVSRDVVSVSERTREAPPGAPLDFHAVDAAPSRLAFEWRMPADAHHGVLSRFVLEYAPSAAPEERRSVAFPAEARAGAVQGLVPGGTYTLRLRGENGAGAGAAAELQAHMSIGAPPRPPAHALLEAVRRSASTVAVRFRANYFSAANGNVTAYTLVLAEEPRNDTPAHLPSWRQVHRLPVWPPYQVTEPYYPFHSSAVEEFTIGSERCEDGGRAYCNGPLKAGTRYFVKLRAFTAPDKFTDTAYTSVYTEVDNTAWIIGACVGAAALCGAAAAAVAVRRRRQARATPAPAVPAQRTSRPVRVQDFIDHYRLMSADSDFRFSEEFEELKHVGREQPCTAADLPVNRPKNRFTNILPYDHSRYKLQPVDDEEGSDYINANYVPGHNSPREFIVTQGPLHCTRDDFWRMVWESGSRAIVMLTRCVEKGREKCDRYWPYDTRPVYYGDIAVTALNESRYPDWTVTELMVCRGAEQRVVKHFHFTTWPDFGVPDPPTALARFVRTFRERCPPDARPVVVHCSAGVGRSGTFITLDTALQQLAAHADTLDVFGMVHAMRRERVWMVQTEQQYICIHQCLVAVLEGQDLAPPHHHNHNHHLNAAFEDDEGIAESGM